MNLILQGYTQTLDTIEVMGNYTAKNPSGSPALGKNPYKVSFGNALLKIALTFSSKLKSIPVFRPIACSMKTRSSVTILPLAPGAAGHPPSPPNELSTVTIPSSSAARALARPKL